MIPNILTTVRLGLVPLFAYYVLFAKNLHAAAIVFILSGITDIVDGIIARKCNMITNFGKVYDPFVDKLMQITAVVCLAVVEIIPYWLLTVVILKELTIIIIGGILYLRKIVVSSNWYGKAATVVFYICVLVIIAWKDIPAVAAATLFGIIIASMIFAAMGYTIDISKNYDKKRV